MHSIYIYDISSLRVKPQVLRFCNTRFCLGLYNVMKQYLFLCSTQSSVVFLPLTVTQFKTWLSLRTSLTQGAVCRYIWIEECSSKRIQSALMLFPFLCQLLVITTLSLYTPLYEKLFTYKTHLLGMSNISASPLPHIPTFSVSSFEQYSSLSLKHTFLV